MITEAMLIKGLTAIGVLTITKTVIVPAAKTVGTQIGKTIGIMANSMNGSNLNKKKAGGKQETNEAAILELMKECDKELKEDKSENEPDNQITIIENIKPEPAFSEKTKEWIHKCKSRYGGFEDVILN